MEFSDWDDFLILLGDLQKDDNLIIIMSRKDKSSYQSNMAKIPAYLNEYSQTNSYIMIYPIQDGVTEAPIDLKNPTILEPIERLDEIGKTIAKIFRRK